MRTNFFFITSNLSNSSTYLVTLSFSQATCLLVYSFTCPLIMLLCLWYNQLVHPSTRSLVHLLCYSVFFTSNLFTCPLTMLLCLWYKQLVHSSTCSLVHLLCYFVFDTSNLSTRLLVHLSTNCLFLLNNKVNISIISIWVVWSIGVIRPILEKEYEERCKWLFVNELWERECEAFDHSKTVIA